MRRVHALPKRITTAERIVIHYRRLILEHPEGRRALTRTCATVNRRVPEVEATLRAAGIEIPEATMHVAPRRPAGETEGERFMRLWRAQVDAGRSGRDAVHHVRKGTHQRVADCERILLEHGIQLPPRGDAHLGPCDPAERAATLYARYAAKGLTGGFAVQRVNASMKVGATEVRRLLALGGIFPETERVAKERPKKAVNARPAPSARKASAGKPRVAEIGDKPVRTIVAAEYRDDKPCVMVDPREALERLRAKGERGRFVPVHEILKGYGREAVRG